ncbi:hypothetical protein LTR36_010334 [Oleoguttula mirabilis]|uniref:Uncharacterized protein n=1 Tax=Oleoguttula mirabilis TaxID=1507867 RepID=A0AAV9J4D1_9PEZI|nr:hypothetical protein LTR36_010334 [Oleoguttula mirabilis]
MAIFPSGTRVYYPYRDSDGWLHKLSMQSPCRRTHAISIKGVEYHLTTDLHDKFVHDFHNMVDDEIINKYALVETGVVDELDEP